MNTMKTIIGLTRVMTMVLMKNKRNGIFNGNYLSRQDSLNVLNPTTKGSIKIL
jgi:hypothetical protein